MRKYVAAAQREGIALRISPWLWFRKLVSQRGRVVSLRSGLSGSILFRVTDSDPASGHHYECSHPHGNTTLAVYQSSNASRSRQ